MPSHSCRCKARAGGSKMWNLKWSEVAGPRWETAKDTSLAVQPGQRDICEPSSAVSKLTLLEIGQLTDVL
eukprot:3307590-Rhodomonas_salina.1